MANTAVKYQPEMEESFQADGAAEAIEITQDDLNWLEYLGELVANAIFNEPILKEEQK